MAKSNKDSENHSETSKEVIALQKKVKTPTPEPVKPTGVPGLPTAKPSSSAMIEAVARRAASKAK